MIGRVARVLVDLESWAVDTLRVRLTRQASAELGLDWLFYRPPTLDVPTGLVLAASDAVILRATLDELHSLAGRDSDVLPIEQERSGEGIAALPHTPTLQME